MIIEGYTELRLSSEDEREALDQRCSQPMRTEMGNRKNTEKQEPRQMSEVSTTNETAIEAALRMAGSQVEDDGQQIPTLQKARDGLAESPVAEKSPVNTFEAEMAINAEESERHDKDASLDQYETSTYDCQLRSSPHETSPTICDSFVFVTPGGWKAPVEESEKIDRDTPAEETQNARLEEFLEEKFTSEQQLELINAQHGPFEGLKTQEGSLQVLVCDKELEYEQTPGQQLPGESQAGFQELDLVLDAEIEQIVEYDIPTADMILMNVEADVQSTSSVEDLSFQIPKTGFVGSEGVEFDGNEELPLISEIEIPETFTRSEDLEQLTTKQINDERNYATQTSVFSFPNSEASKWVKFQLFIRCNRCAKNQKKIETQLKK